MSDKADPSFRTSEDKDLNRRILILTLAAITSLGACKVSPSDEEVGLALGRVGKLLEREGPDAALRDWSETGLADDSGGLTDVRLRLFKDGLCLEEGCVVDQAGWVRRADALAEAMDGTSNPYRAMLVSGSYLSAGDASMAKKWLELACPGSSVDCVLGIVERLRQELVGNFSYDAIDVMDYFNTASTAYRLLGDKRFLEHGITAGAAYRVELGERLMTVAESRGLSRQAAESAFCSGLLLGRYPDRQDEAVHYPDC